LAPARERIVESPAARYEEPADSGPRLPEASHAAAPLAPVAGAPDPASLNDAQWLAAVSAAAPQAAPPAAPPVERRGSPLWPILARGALRMALLIALGAAVFAVVRLLDGASIARRERLLATGRPVWGTVEDVEAAPSLGQLLYRVTFVYPSPAGLMRAQALAGEGAFGRLLRGKPVLLRVSALQPGGVCLDEDFGYGRERGALLLLALGLLIVGGWSFIFRVI
jgi:hypothetical protein